MNIAFRVDASNNMGIGHVMRCLTLARALSVKEGAFVRFFCRYLPPSVHQLLVNSNIDVCLLASQDICNEVGTLAHSEWLGVSQLTDAKEVCAYMSGKHWHWIIVDHYAIDKEWHGYAKSLCSNIMVIDDLADRRHDCTLLLDQTYGRKDKDYQYLLPEECKILLGSQYALLRPEFYESRKLSLERRESPVLKKLLISMGGTDNQNATGLVLDSLESSNLPNGTTVTVVMGSGSPSLDTVIKAVSSSRFQSEVCVDANNMAALMLESDLVIGAAGTTSWERCCLGVPTIMVVLASNQAAIAEVLSELNAVLLIGGINDISEKMGDAVDMLMRTPEKLRQISLAARTVTDGMGVKKVVDLLESIS